MLACVGIVQDSVHPRTESSTIPCVDGETEAQKGEVTCLVTRVGKLQSQDLIRSVSDAKAHPITYHVKLWTNLTGKWGEVPVACRYSGQGLAQFVTTFSPLVQVFSWSQMLWTTLHGSLNAEVWE